MWLIPKALPRPKVEFDRIAGPVQEIRPYGKHVPCMYACIHARKPPLELGRLDRAGQMDDVDLLFFFSVALWRGSLMYPRVVLFSSVFVSSCREGRAAEDEALFCSFLVDSIRCPLSNWLVRVINL